MISTQPVLGRAVAAIGVGVVALHQFLEARLDLRRRGVDLEPERVERLALGIADRARLRRAPARSRAQALAEQSERIGAGSPREIRPRPRRLPVPIFQVGRWPVIASFW